jgi:hypothetical protein
MSKYEKERIDFENKLSSRIKNLNISDLFYDIKDEISSIYTTKNKHIMFKQIIADFIKGPNLCNKFLYEMEMSDRVMDYIINKYKNIPKTKVAKSNIHGNGLFALETIKKGNFVTFYPMHVIQNGNLIYKSPKIISLPDFNIHKYLLAGPEQELFSISAHPNLYEDHKNGHIANHSDNANVYYQLITRDGFRCNIWGLVSIKDIKKGEEITADYGPIHASNLN